MKKTKLLMPILGVGAVAATVAPMVAMTGCTKVEIGEFSVVQAGEAKTATSTFTVTLTWNEFEDDSQNKIKVTEITGSIRFGEFIAKYADLGSGEYDRISGDLNRTGFSEIKISLDEGKPFEQAGTYKGNLKLKYSLGSPEAIEYTINGFDVVVTEEK